MTFRPIELQVTTNFSFLQGGSRPQELAAQAAALGYEAIGVTDRNTLAGIVRAYKAAKERDLGVPGKLIEIEGAVSDAVVRAMAEGALERTGANVAMAVSGIAGPSGAVPGKPVGTVWFALAQKLVDRLECQGHLIQFDGDRDAVRRQSVEYALNLLRALPQPQPA